MLEGSSVRECWRRNIWISLRINLEGDIIFQYFQTLGLDHLPWRLRVCPSASVHYWSCISFEIQVFQQKIFFLDAGTNGNSLHISTLTQPFSTGAKSGQRWKLLQESQWIFEQSTYAWFTNRKRIWYNNYSKFGNDLTNVTIGLLPSGNERDLQSLLSSMSQQQLMQLFGNVGGMSGLSSLMVSPEAVGRGSTSSRSRSSGATSGSTSQARSAASATTPAPALTPSSTNVTGTLPTTPLTSGVPSLGNLTNLQQILSGIQIPDSALGVPAAGAEKSEKPSGNICVSVHIHINQNLTWASNFTVDLSEGLSTEVLHPILSNPDFMRQLQDFLPPSEGNDTAQMVRDTVQSPQFAQVIIYAQPSFSSIF